MASRDALPERERAQSRSGHRDHSAELRNRRRDEESDKARRRRDRQSRRDTLEGAVEPPLAGNALGIHPSSLHPGQGLYAPAAPPVTTSDPNTSHAGGAPSYRPPTGHGNAPQIAGAASVPGSAYYRDAQQNNGAGSFYSQQGDSYISRPSSTPIGPVHASWDSFANASLNSLGLPETGRDANSQRGRPVSASNMMTARDSVSSWGTAESTQANGDLFSTLRPLASAPADNGYTHTDLLPRSDGQLLGVVRVYFRPFHLHTLTVFSGPSCANCDAATTVAATLWLRARRGQPLILSSRKPPAFSIASVALLYFSTAAFQSRRSGIPLCFCATATIFSNPSPISISHSRYPTPVSLQPDAFDSIISSNLGSSPN
jgi:hypothetical protein